MIPTTYPPSLHNRGLDRFDLPSRLMEPIGPALPRRIPGAIWQAGVTRGHHNLRPLLDGEPVPLAFAAGDGWVMCHPERDEVGQEVEPAGAKRLHGMIGVISIELDAVLRRGRVIIVAGDRC